MGDNFTGPAAPAWFGATGGHLQRRYRLFLPVHVRPAIRTAIRIVLPLEQGQQPDGYLHVTLLTNTVPNERYSFAAPSAQAVIVFQDLGWNRLTQVLTADTAG